ncbi:MAG TPA: hypothetical protein VKD69_13130 [Vicinamibacterales bacterium]|nr:hypothetical protein [Vicinamibacterales bacterium]
MTYLIAWTLIAALIGYFGRDRRGGFWGFFFFSLLLSPLVAGLALILGGRNRQAAAVEAERRRVRTVTSSAGITASTAGASTSAGFLGIAKLWVGSIFLFAVLYWLVFGFNFTSAGSALYLSIQIGTFGFNAQVPPDTNPVVLQVLFALQRLSVLALITLAVSRFVMLRQETLIERVIKAGSDTMSALDAIGVRLTEQERLIASIQVRAPAATDTPPHTEVAHTTDHGVDVTSVTMTPQ